MTLREGLEKLRDDLSEQLSDPDCVHGAGEYAFQRLDALLSTADREQLEAVALRKAQRALLENLETVDVEERTVTLTVSTALWENWQDDTRHHPDTRPGEQREVVKVLSDARGMAHRHYIYEECQDCGMLRGSIDVVLVRIGGK